MKEYNPTDPNTLPLPKTQWETKPEKTECQTREKGKVRADFKRLDKGVFSKRK